MVIFSFFVIPEYDRANGICIPPLKIATNSIKFIVDTFPTQYVERTLLRKTETPDSNDPRSTIYR